MVRLTQVLIAATAAMLATTTAHAAPREIAPAAAPTTATAGIASSRGDRMWLNHDLHQRYCIVDPAMRVARLQRGCHTLAEWQVKGVDPRRMRLLSPAS